MLAWCQSYLSWTLFISRGARTWAGELIQINLITALVIRQVLPSREPPFFLQLAVTKLLATLCEKNSQRNSSTVWKASPGFGLTSLVYQGNEKTWFSEEETSALGGTRTPNLLIRSFVGNAYQGFHPPIKLSISLIKCCALFYPSKPVYAHLSESKRKEKLAGTTSKSELLMKGLTEDVDQLYWLLLVFS